MNFWKDLPKNLFMKFDLLRNLNQQKVFKINKNYDYCFFRADDFNNKYFNFVEKINIKKFILLERPFSTKKVWKTLNLCIKISLTHLHIFAIKCLHQKEMMQKNNFYKSCSFFKPSEIILKKNIDILYIFTNRQNENYKKNILINFYAKKT